MTDKKTFLSIVPFCLPSIYMYIQRRRRTIYITNLYYKDKYKVNKEIDARFDIDEEQANGKSDNNQT